MVTQEEVGRRVKRAREELGWSQRELGQRLKRPRTYAAVSDIERGKTQLSIEELGNIAALLGKDLSYFVAANSTPTTAVVYRRSAPDHYADQAEIDRAVEDFKRVARQVAAKQAGTRSK